MRGGSRKRKFSRLCFETYFDANYTYYNPNKQILKSLGLFENLAFVIMSTRENIRLIARASLGQECRSALEWK